MSSTVAAFSSSSLPVCNYTVPPSVPCAPCYLGAASTTVSAPFNVRPITVEVVPYVFSVANGSASTSYSTSTVSASSAVPTISRVSYAMNSSGLPDITVTNTDDLTWHYRGVPLSWPTTYVEYFDFVGAAAGTGGSSACANYSAISSWVLPSTYVEASLIVPLTTAAQAPHSGTSILPSQVMNYLDSLPTVSQQMGGQSLSVCSTTWTQHTCSTADYWCSIVCGTWTGKLITTTELTFTTGTTVLPASTVPETENIMNSISTLTTMTYAGYTSTMYSYTLSWVGNATSGASVNSGCVQSCAAAGSSTGEAFPVSHPTASLLTTITKPPVMQPAPFAQTLRLSSKQSPGTQESVTVDPVHTSPPPIVTAKPPSPTSTPTENSPNTAQPPTSKVSPPPAEPQTVSPPTRGNNPPSSANNPPTGPGSQTSCDNALCVLSSTITTNEPNPEPTLSPAPGPPTTATREVGTSDGNNPPEPQITTKSAAIFTAGSQTYTVSQVSSGAYAIGSTTLRQGDATTMPDGQTMTVGSSGIQIGTSVVSITAAVVTESTTTGIGSYIWSGLNPTMGSVEEISTILGGASGATTTLPGGAGVVTVAPGGSRVVTLPASNGVVATTIFGGASGVTTTLPDGAGVVTVAPGESSVVTFSASDRAILTTLSGGASGITTTLPNGAGVVTVSAGGSSVVTLAESSGIVASASVVPATGDARDVEVLVTWPVLLAGMLLVMLL